MRLFPECRSIRQRERRALSQASGMTEMQVRWTREDRQRAQLASSSSQCRQSAWGGKATKRSRFLAGVAMPLDLLLGGRDRLPVGCQEGQVNS
jgi:hypothetical protein